MQIYLVGGAVRDSLLDLPVHDRDYVVVGATAQQMKAQGFTQVGKSFPVFLHPKTKEECALARTERKTGQGYTGFQCDFGPEVSLETDLKRRDITINAIAQDQNGQLIDPYGGQDDIKAKQLRHVSPAFNEDPLRVLRVARFAAKLAHLGFKIADETIVLMSQMASSNELQTLTPERVYTEMEKALKTDSPHIFFETLRRIGALKVIIPELDQLFGIPAPAHWHPEIDTGIHTLLTLQRASQLTQDIAVRFAALSHDLGKAGTPQACWPSHHGHGQRGVSIIKALSERLKIPNNLRDLASLSSQWHIQIHRVNRLSNEQILDILDQCDAWRKPERFNAILKVCEADIKGRLNHEKDSYPQAKQFQSYLEELGKIPVQSIVREGFKGKEIREQLYLKRLNRLNELQAREM
ncbi:MAG: Multifunctional CCA protein [Candidatus Celerinatantimonas neptuna]|nr:MAG: Multifunctional CCA protein [Candidatus Celerinatantimonas neptuna]